MNSEETSGPDWSHSPVYRRDCYGWPGVQIGRPGRTAWDGQVTLMGVMLMGKLRGLPAHTDIVAGFRFGRVVRAHTHIGRRFPVIWSYGCS